MTVTCPTCSKLYNEHPDWATSPDRECRRCRERAADFAARWNTPYFQHPYQADRPDTADRARSNA